MRRFGLFVAAALSISVLLAHVIGTKVGPMTLFPIKTPDGGKPLSIFVDTLDEEWNSELTQNHCTDCSCEFHTDDDLEPLIHCLIKESPFAVKSKKDATFIFVPIYTNHCRKNGRPSTLSSIQSVRNDESYTKWKGCRHLVIDSYRSAASDVSLFDSTDQHLVINTNMTIEFVRENRWMNSRHILVPPLQALSSYPVKEKVREILCIGTSDRARTWSAANNIKRIADVDDKAVLVEEISASMFTVLFPGEGIEPFLIYEIIRAHSVPVLVAPPFLPAYANTHINYSRISIRTNDVDEILSRIKGFDRNGIEAELSKSAGYLTWPKNPHDVAPNNAAGVLFDYLNTRHRVIRPVLRRTFIGTDTPLP